MIQDIWSCKCSGDTFLVSRTLESRVNHTMWRIIDLIRLDWVWKIDYD